MRNAPACLGLQSASSDVRLNGQQVGIAFCILLEYSYLTTNLLGAGEIEQMNWIDFTPSMRISDGQTNGCSSMAKAVESKNFGGNLCFQLLHYEQLLTFGHLLCCRPFTWKIQDSELSMTMTSDVYPCLLLPCLMVRG